MDNQITDKELTAAIFRVQNAIRDGKRLRDLAEKARQDKLDYDWYKFGFYDLLGYDRNGRSYTLVSGRMKTS